MSDKRVYKDYTEQDLIDLELKRGKKRCLIAFPLINLFFILLISFKLGFYLTPYLIVICLLVNLSTALILKPLYRIFDTPQRRAIMCNNAIKYLEKKEQK